MPRVRSSSRRSLLRPLGALAAGGIIWTAWTPLGLPLAGAPGDAPVAGLWRSFFAVCLPALFVAFTLLHEGFGRAAAGGDAARAARRAARWDRASYAVLLLFLALMATGGARWRWLLGAFFVAVLLGKVGLAVTTISRCLVPAAGDREPAALRASLVLVAALAYAALVPYVAIAVSTGGDEPIYLLNVESLSADGDLDVRDNVARGDAGRFYWGPAAAGVWERSFPGVAALLLPGYALARALAPHAPLAGRLGAMLTIALCAALAAGQAYALCRDLGASPRAAFRAWLCVALTPPMLVHAGHVYPEIPAALLLAVAVRGVLRIRGRPWPAAVAVVAGAGALVLLKDRYTPLGLGLLAWALAEVGARRPRLALAGLTALLGAAVWVFRADPLPRLFPNLAMLPAGPTWSLALRAALGLVGDQEFGLLYYAPQWAFALVGVGVLWRRRRRACAGLLALGAFYLAVVVRYRWMRWFGGWTPSPRFVVPLLPVLAPFLAAAFDRAGGRLRAALGSLAAAWAAAVAFALCVVPTWRYDDADGRARLLEVVGRALGLDVARFLPSLVAPSPWTWAALGLAAGAGALALRAGYRGRWEAGGASGGRVLLPAGPAAALVAGVALAWVSAAAVLPTWSLEAEAMRRSAGTAFQADDYGHGGWALRADGWVAEPIVTWPGWTEIRVAAGAFTTTGRAPRLTVRLDGQPVGDRALRAVTGHWVRGEYLARVRTGFGRPVLRLDLAELLDEPGAGRFQHAYVDRVRIRPLAGASPVAGDCVSDPFRYCPEAPVTRAQLAGLLVEARHGGRAPVPAASGAFADVARETAEAAPIEMLAAAGIMPGCAADRFCPDAAVARDELAGILLRAVDGAAVTPPPATGRFRDVPPTAPDAPWIELLGARQLTCGCGAGNYCPASPVTWEQAAKFLARAFPGSYPPAPCRATWW